MRKLLLLSSVFALSFGVFTHNETNAGTWGKEWTLKAFKSENNKNLNTIDDSINGRFEELYASLQQMSEQLSTVNTANTGALVRGTSASDQNRAITAREVANFGTVTSFANAAGTNCVNASAGGGTAKVNEGAERETASLIEERMKNINSEAGTDAANGLVDFQRKMFERSKALCDPAGNGGANKFCSGSGNAHVTLATILTPDAFRNQPPLSDRLEYIQDLLFTRVPVSVSPDLLENPDTETMNMIVEADRLKAEMSVGQTLFSILQGNRTKTESRVTKSLRDRLEAGGWSSEKIDEMTADGISKNALYHALTVGSYTSEFILQKANANERDLLANILAETQLNNVLQFEQYKLLEAIALATATNIVVNRDDAIKVLNNRISRRNAGK